MAIQHLRTAGITCFCLLATHLACSAKEPPFRETDAPFAVGHLAGQKGWVQAPGITADTWKPVEQTDLAHRLASAKPLELVDIAPAPRRISQGRLPYFCPNPDGRSWDIINPYHKKYLSEGQVLVHDFHAGESKLFCYGTTDGLNVITPHGTDFHMKSSWYLAKKMIFVLPTTTHGLVFLVYDPAVNDFVSSTTPFSGRFELYALDIGSDNRLYGIGQPDSKDGFRPFIFDPKTFETTIYSKQEVGQQTPFPYYRGSAMQGDWMYCKYGHEPWHLVAFNFATEEFRHLATTANIKGDHTTIGLQAYSGGIGCHIKQGVEIAGIDSFDEELFEGWLVDGKVLPRSSDVAPWSQETVQRPPRSKYRFREFQRWPQGFSCDVAPPEIEEGSSAPIDTDGHVKMSYRLTKEDAWSTLRYQVKLYPGIVRRLIEVNESTLFAVDEGYGQHIFYDLSERRLMRFLVQRVSPYAVGVVDDQVFVSGYPTFVTVAYDLTKAEQMKEPKQLGYLGAESDTHTPLAGLTRGADGCVYIAGTTVGRRRDGGGMAWYDLETGRVGSRTMIDHRIFWLTPASNGRYILLSSKSEQGSRIFCWDTERKTFIYDIPSPTASHAGPLEEALPGLVIGHAADDDGGLLYGLEAATGNVLWRKRVPASPVTAFSMVRRHCYTFRRGPDGFIWASFDDTLVRIDPRGSEVLPVGKMEPVQIAFARNNVYASGGPSLRRIEGLSVERLSE